MELREVLAEINILIHTLGVPGALFILVLLFISIIAPFVVKQNSKTNKSIVVEFQRLITTLEVLTDKVNPKLPVDQSIVFFRAIMTGHIWEKLEFLKSILDRNNIAERRDQIEINIARRFKSITTGEAEKLSKCDSVCGDMGRTLQSEIDWDKLLNAVYAIFFSSDDPHKKLDDVHMLMDGYVDDIARVIEENGIHNKE